MNDNVNNFPEIVAVPNRTLTWVIRIYFGGLLLLLLAVFIFLPFVVAQLSDDHYRTGAVVFMIIFYPLWLWACIAVVKQFLKAKKNHVIGISVNNKGLHFHTANGETQSIFYNQLEKDKYESEIDVGLTERGRYSPVFLFVHYKGRKQVVYFNRMDFGFGHFTGNVDQLRAHFIKGIKLFRTDLNISPLVYSEFYINAETLKFSRKEYWRVSVVVAIILVILFLAINYWMKYRFG